MEAPYFFGGPVWSPTRPPSSTGLLDSYAAPPPLALAVGRKPLRLPPLSPAAGREHLRLDLQPQATAHENPR